MNENDLNALRVKVAELCGLKRYKRPWDGRVFLCKEQPGTKERIWHVTIDAVDVVNSDVPNYPSDLNDCAAMREELTEEEWYTFVDSLLGKPWTAAWDWDDVTKLVSAPADAQCRAFIAAKELTSKPGGLTVNA